MRPPLPPGLLVLAVALTGLAVLAAAHAWTAPETATVEQLAALEGARVALDARVVHEAPGFLVLADHTGRVPAFPPRRVAGALAAGDEVRALGVVGRGDGGLVLSLESVRVLARPDERVLAVGDLARFPERYAGAPVTAEGVLARAAGDGWRLADAFEGARVKVVPERVPDAWREGDVVRVDGAFRYHARTLTYRLEVASWTWP